MLQMGTLLTGSDGTGLSSNLDHPGTIEVLVTQIRMTGRQPYPGSPAVLDTARSIHEGSKKIGSHCVTYVISRPAAI